MDNEPSSVSTRPYLIRALHEWCTDCGLTPYIVVRVDDSVQVPREYVNNGEIVLNVSHDATSGLQMANDSVSFKARFGGRPRDIMVPVNRVVAIYARENGQGMAFPAEEGAAPVSAVPDDADQAAGQPVDAGRAASVLQSVKATDHPGGAPSPKPPAGKGRRPALKRIK